MEVKLRRRVQFSRRRLLGRGRLGGVNTRPPVAGRAVSGAPMDHWPSFNN